MAYAYITFAQLKTELSLRLGDSSKIFWVDTELGLYLKEAMRAFGLFSAFWRARGTFTTTSGTAFYDLPTNLSGSLLSYTVTDRDIIQILQYHLLEDASSQSTWNGTAMFSLTDLTNAIQNRLNQFLSDTGIVVNRSVISAAGGGTGRISLVDTIIDVRRVAWLGNSPIAYYVPLWREDERMLTAYDQTWSTTSAAATPDTYSVMAPPPLTVQLSNVPIVAGNLELLTVDAGPTLDPANSATVLGIPDDLTPGIKWGALADLLGIDGIASDPVRAEYSERMYQLYVTMARNMPVVVSGQISGAPLIPSTLQEVDTYSPTWENIRDTPTDMILAAPNLMAFNPVPNATLTITLDVVRKADIPAADGTQVQLGREQLDMILDLAERLALYKVFGAEWHATERQEKNFVIQSLTYNQRLSAQARAAVSASYQSQRQKRGIPRRLDTSSDGLGSLKTMEKA